MYSVKEINLAKVIAWSQLDRVVVTLIMTCTLPFVFHAFPFMAGPEMGQRWLPMFYAPLIASLCFRPHVALIAGISAPMINHALFGMPDGRVLPVLVFELVALSAVLASVSTRQQVRGWHVGLVFIFVRVFSLLMFSSTGKEFAAQLPRSFLMAWPGVVMLVILAEIIGRSVPRKDL